MRSQPRTSPRRLLGNAFALLLMMTALPTGAVSSSAGTRLPNPEDRYALAGGCYAVRSLATGGYIVRNDGGFAVASDDLGAAAPFHFQATDLGRYLLFGTAKDFFAADKGIVGTVTDLITESDVGGIASGLSVGITDQVADTLKTGPLGTLTGRGSKIVAAPAASEVADWEIDQVGPAFTIALPATGQSLSAGEGGELDLVDSTQADARSHFGFQLADGCATFPEIEVNVDGPVAKGASPFSEVRGYLDAHLHMMAFEFIGGKVRCGRPWHPYGVERALVDCPDHLPGGHGAVLETVLSGGNVVEGHDTHGWPTFAGWPRYNSLTHEQIYYKWLERAWRGGLRMFTNLLVDNHALCTVYPFKKNSCNEMDGVRLQAKRIRQLERYIDAQSGGPGEGWFRIVTDPFQARRVINSGKLAVILGIEVSEPLDCGITLEIPACDTAQIDKQLDEVWDLGVRQMEIANKFDNALTGVTGDNGTTGIVVNGGNLTETGHLWQMQTCTAADGDSHDHQQLNIHDDLGTPDALTGRDSIFAAVLEVTGTSGVAPLYPPGPHCNVRGLTPLGEHMVRRMIQKGMIFDPDHMSARARHQALDILQAEGYSGVVSSHSWADDTIYPRVYQLGGVVTPYAGSSEGFVAKWRQHKQWANPDTYFGFGYGSDINGFGAQGPPRGAGVANKVSYPFTGFGGVTVNQQHSGSRVYDINTDGVAHYGLYPDWIEDLRVQAGDAIVNDMLRGPEAYLQMWERAIGISANACSAKVADLTEKNLKQLVPGMTPEQVLRVLGQPKARTASSFEFCMGGGSTATALFSPAGSLLGVAAH